ncbi:MAG: membrane protein insertion efficiency factor YidD [Methylococcaceae bacterium TMED69]|nr:MAG: membrane protein insertion efficiency factor YidD [Methylococcaceae bacterium TMED69]
MKYPARFLIVRFIGIYIKYISPFLAPSCRFTPSCSSYAQEAVSRHGIRKGLWLSVTRVIRCNPLGGKGHDPVP